MNDTTRARVTSYISDIFTTEMHLNLSVGLIGPTATNIAVTPMMAFYGGGVYYNEEECVSYVEEEVPGECLQERAGILSFTCLTQARESLSDLHMTLLSPLVVALLTYFPPLMGLC